MKSKLKLIAVVFVLLNFLFWGFFAVLIIPDKARLRRFRNRVALRTSRVLSQLLGLEIATAGLEKIGTKPLFVVANHLSYLDTIALLGTKQLCFVTSHEMRESFPLGLIVRAAGCIFVERRSNENILGEIDEISEAIKAGFTVVVFPEATSHNGTELLPFKRALFTAAVVTQTPVLPLVIQYESVDGQAITLRNRDEVFWYGEMDFAPHFIPFLDKNTVKMSITALEEIAVHPGSRRHEISALAREQIVSRFIPVR